VKVTEEKQVRKAVKLKGYTRFTNEWEVGEKGSSILMTFRGESSNVATIKKRHSSKRGSGTPTKVTVSDVSTEITFGYVKTPRKEDVSTREITTPLTPWSRVLLQKLTCHQLAMKFPTFCGTPNFITALSNVRHPPIFRATLI
jgi:hypothetical protein